MKKTSARQLELPFTVRGRRTLRRAKGQGRRAWKCNHPNYVEFMIVAACDAAEARSVTLGLIQEITSAKFLEIRVRRCPEHDAWAKEQSKSCAQGFTEY